MMNSMSCPLDKPIDAPLQTSSGFLAAVIVFHKEKYLLLGNESTPDRFVSILSTLCTVTSSLSC